MRIVTTSLHHPAVVDALDFGPFDRLHASATAPGSISVAVVVDRFEDWLSW